MREVDDFQSRVQIKNALKEGNLSLDDEESVEKFFKSYIVERPLTMKCLKVTGVRPMAPVQNGGPLGDL